MYKKFLLVLTICLGIFSSVAFADVQPITIPADKVSEIGSKWVVSYRSSTGYFSIFKLGDNATISLEGTSVIRFTNVIKEYSYLGSGWSTSSATGINTSSDLVVYYSGVDFPNLSNIVAKKEAFSNLNFHQPSLAETQAKALGNLMTDFGARLKVLLPVGVSILAILLGASLIPRLVAWFL